MSKYDQITSLPESPSFLKDINTIEGAEQADQWGREQARNFMA
jgi:hypothetical protein